MRKSFNASDLPSAGPYSHGVEACKLVFLSGQTPFDPATGKLVEGSIAEQTRQCFANLFKVLGEVGVAEDSVQKVTVYLTDMADFAEMNEVYKAQFSAPYPARTTIGVAALPLGAKVEIELIAGR